MSNDDLVNGILPNGLTPEEENKISIAFKAFDKDGSGFIDSDEFTTIFNILGQNFTEEEIQKMISDGHDYDKKDNRLIDYEGFKTLIARQKKFQNASNADDTLDAFVALGGDSDSSGSIDAHRLIDIIKNQFQMTINIEKLIEDIDEDGSGQIEYDEFKLLLGSNSE